MELYSAEVISLPKPCLASQTSKFPYVELAIPKGKVYRFYRNEEEEIMGGWGN